MTELTHIVTLLAYGYPVQAIVAAFEWDERTDQRNLPLAPGIASALGAEHGTAAAYVAHRRLPGQNDVQFMHPTQELAIRTSDSILSAAVVTTHPAIAAGIIDHHWSVAELLWHKVPKQPERPSKAFLEFKKRWLG